MERIENNEVIGSLLRLRGDLISLEITTGLTPELMPALIKQIEILEEMEEHFMKINPAELNESDMQAYTSLKEFWSDHDFKVKSAIKTLRESI